MNKKLVYAGLLGLPVALFGAVASVALAAPVIPSVAVPVVANVSVPSTTAGTDLETMDDGTASEIDAQDTKDVGDKDTETNDSPESNNETPGTESID